MRIPKPLIAVLAIISLCIAIFFSLPASKPTPTEQTATSTGPAPQIRVKNEPFLNKKLEELQFYELNNVKHVSFTVADSPQTVAVAKRQSQNGTVYDSLSYSRYLTDDTLTLNLYVSPEAVPYTDHAELERQYTQLALIALYQTSSSPDTFKTEEDMLTYVSEFRQNGTENYIFEVK